jgi:hypothetical protein
MPRWTIYGIIVLLSALVVAACFLGLIPTAWTSKSSPEVAKDHKASGEKAAAADQRLTPAEIQEILAPREKLPETAPPLDLPILTYGNREYLPAIRKPRFMTAQQGDVALAADEPVIGLVIGKDARAYSTNQLNDHEMVLDEVAGIPVLVTY